MKNIIFTCVLLFSFFASKAQVFIKQDIDESITISPRGIQGKYPNPISTSNVGIGKDALKSITSGTSNYALGNGALQSLTVNNGSVAIGLNASNLFNDPTTVGSRNIAIGFRALELNVSGKWNTAIGDYALNNNTSDNNIAVGDQALSSNTSGNENLAIGIYALENNTSGKRNLSIGNESNFDNTNANENISIGYQSLYKHSASSYIVGIGVEKQTQNMAIGYQALRNTNPSTLIVQGVSGNGVRNMGLGYQALYNNTRGEENTIVGYQAGYSNTTGNRNVFLGYKAGYNHDADDVLVIENSDANRALIRGDFANDKVGINRLKTDLDATSFTFQVNGDASKNSAGNWSSHSDRRLKKNISYLNSQEILQKVLNLKGVTYEWNDTKTGTNRPNGLQYGFIAQEIKEIFPSKIQEDKNGYLMTAYGDYDPMFVESIKALKELIDEQRKMIEVLKNKVEILSAENNEKAKLSDK
jgi:trimeric autotransporter adhesin